MYSLVSPSKFSQKNHKQPHYKGMIILALVLSFFSTKNERTKANMTMPHCRHIFFPCINFSYTKWAKICMPRLIHHRQIFSGGGYRTKMKIWSDENEKLVGKFPAPPTSKNRSSNFSPVPGFFRCGGTEKSLKTVEKH